MTTTTDTIPDPDLSDTDYDEENMKQVWMTIKKHLVDKGRVYAYKLYEGDILSSTPYSETTLSRKLLTQLREALEDDDIIHVKLEEPEDGGAIRKVWLLNDDD